jgi:hypothetical protein
VGDGLTRMSFLTQYVGDKSFFEALDIAMPVFLVVMGVVASWSAAARWQRIAWTAGFVIVGLVAVTASDQVRKQARTENLGGDQFFAVSVLYGPGMDPKGKFPLAVSNSRDVPIYDAAFAITRRGDFYQNGIEFSVGTIYPHDRLRRVNVAIPTGDYAIEMRTKAGGWFFERLILTALDDGNFHQTYYIRRIGSDERLMDVP